MASFLPEQAERVKSKRDAIVRSNLLEYKRLRHNHLSLLFTQFLAGQRRIKNFANGFAVDNFL